MNKQETNGEKETNHLDADGSLFNNKDIKTDEDLQEAEAGNVVNPEAEKGLLNGPAIDLVSQPSAKDEDQ